MKIGVNFNPAPFLVWFKDYNRDKFIKDLIAGLTIAAVLVPQSMAYALLAGMPPIYGLYASFLPVAVAALFGSSRFLATGPVAIIALLSASAVQGLAEPGSQRWIELMAILAIMVGFITLFVGLFKLGFVVELISTSVITGFISAGALVIALSQVGHFLGFSVPKTTHIYTVIADIIQKIEQANPYTLAIGVLAYAIIWISRKIHPLVPGALLAVIITSLLSYHFQLKSYGVSIVGNVPQGIPGPYIPSVDFETLASLWGGALVIAAVGLMEALSIAKRLALQAGDKWDVNQELIGQGLANIVAGIFKGFPVGGSFSRSALNFQLNGQSPLVGVITASVIGLTLLFLAPAFYYLPKATLSAIVLSAVIGLIKPQEIFKLYKINKMDGIVAGITFASVFFMDLWVALTLGIVISLGSFVYKTMYPRIVVLTRNPQSHTFVNAERERLPECPQILYIRPNMPIYYANAEYVYEYILQKAQERQKDRPLKYVLVDLEAVNYIDAAGGQTLMRLFDELKRMGLEPALANIGCDIFPILDRLGFDKKVREDLVFDSKGQSITELFKKIDHEYCAKVCPYAVFKECYSVKPADFKPITSL
jgi:SulP family sulfate permease